MVITICATGKLMTLVRRSVWPVMVLLFMIQPAFAKDGYFASSIITGVTPSTTVRLGVPFTINGTATPGTEAVEISLNGGTGFRPATLTGGTWSYTYTPSHAGTITIKSRALEAGVWESTAAGSGPNVINVTVLANPDPTTGPGGPILLVYDPGDEFGKYTAEILRTEGFNSFATLPIGSVNAGVLANYDVVILSPMSISAGQAGMFTDFVTDGGNLIAYRPDTELDALLGIGSRGGQRSNQYLLVNTTAGSPGQGIVSQTMQFHGDADNFIAQAGTDIIATFYSSASTSTPYHAITQREVGTNGGRAIAFGYDLNRSIVYTRQGNPDWQDDTDPIQARVPLPANPPSNGKWPYRGLDLFYNNQGGPHWFDIDKITIPQADEQQRLLANIILTANYHRKPLPRIWYLPSGHKAALVMTGDDHAVQGTTGYFNLFKSMSPSNTPDAVADWRAVRGSSYLYSNTNITNDAMVPLQEDGFEFSIHFQTEAENLNPNVLPFWIGAQFPELYNTLPSVDNYSTQRTHAIVWWGWAIWPKLALQQGIRLDDNYYHYPPDVFQTPGGYRNGVFTGSALAMRFADLDGTIINSYQLNTQMNDEAPTIQTYPAAVNELLDRAVGAEGYYGAYCLNWHTDNADQSGAINSINSAQARNVPVISARQLLNWIDARETTTFSNMQWNANVLTFNINGGARNLRAMLPMQLEDGLRLQSVSRAGSSIGFTAETIKGIEYGFFDGSQAGAYEAVYTILGCDPMLPTLNVDKTTICAGEQVALSISTTSANAPFTVVVNGVTYTNVQPDVTFYTYTAPNAGPQHLFSGTPASNENVEIIGGNVQPLNLGVRFTPTSGGVINGIRFMRHSGAVTSHDVALYAVGNPVPIATATSAGETGSGWVDVTFPTAVPVIANQDYVAAYYAPDGHYRNATTNFSGPVTSGNLTAPGGSGNNGYYLYNAGASQPTTASAGNFNYLVDVSFTPTSALTSQTFTLTSITDAENCSESGNPNSTKTVTIDNNCTVTPVTFVNFTGRAQNSNSIVLNWTTGMELNADRFEIERSTDGHNYASVGQVKAMGFSSLNTNYQFTDHNLQPQRYFYRLRQVDIDNKFMYSSVVSVVLGGHNEFQLFQNTPNPVAATSVITYVVPVNTQLRLALYDNTGRMIKVLANGAHQPGTYRATVSKGNLANGVYYYRLDADRTSLVKKLIIQ